MSKKNRRPDKGQPGSAGSKRARLKEQKRLEAVEAQWRAGAPERVREVMGEVAAHPAAAIRRPYQPPIHDWLAETARRVGVPPRDDATHSDDPVDVPVVVALQPDSFYDAVPYGMTGIGEMVLMALREHAEAFESYEQEPITVEVVEPLPTEWVLDAAAMMVAERVNLAYVAAYVQTGYLVTEDTEALFTANEKARWAAAVTAAAHAYPALAADLAPDAPDADWTWLPDMESAEDYLPSLYTVLHPLVATQFDILIDQRFEAAQAAPA